MGSTFWVRKTAEIKLLLNEKDPDIAIITEANIFDFDQDYQIHIPDYTLLLPKTMKLMGNCRLAVLVREGIIVQVLDNFMEEHVSSIWMKIPSKGHRKIHLGAIYKEHQWIGQKGTNTTKAPAEQLARWGSFIDQWIAASRGAETFVIGDVNLDFNKWRNPDSDLEAMTNLVKKQN